MLTKGAKVDVFVTAIENGGKWVHLWAQADPQEGDELENLMRDVGFMENATVANIDTMAVGDVYLAKYNEDGKWYRAKVVAVNKHDKSVKVFFIDYGNSESLSIGDIVKGLPKHFKLPPQAIQFTLADILPLNGTTYSTEEMEYISENLTYEEFSAYVLREGTVGNPPSLRVFTGLESSTPISQKFVSDGAVREYNNSHLAQESIPNTLLENLQKYHVYLTFYESPVNFWIQLTSHATILDELHAEIMETFEIDGFPGQTNIDIGSVCLAKYTETDTFYRAVVTNLFENGSCEVTFLDYGNSEVTSISNLKQMPSKYCQLPAQAVQCSLHGAIATSRDFQSFLDCETLYAKVLSVTASGLHIVQLRVQEGGFSEPNSPQDMSTRTVSRGFNRQSPRQLKNPEMTPVVRRSPGRESERELSPKLLKYHPLQFNLGGYIDVCISHVELSGHFHCQLLENAEKLNSLMIDLQQSYSSASKALVDLGSESLCVVRDLSDKVIYRAQVISGDINKVTLKYVDFGNTDTVEKKDIYQINAAHTTLPTQAVSCCLAGTDECDISAIVRTLKRYNSRIAVVGKVIMKTGQSYEMELTDTRDGEDVNLADLVKQLMRTRVDLTTQSSATTATKTMKTGSDHQSSTQLVRPIMEVGMWEEIVITYIADPEHFYCQFLRSASELDTLMADIEQYCSAPDPAGGGLFAALSQPCLAQYTEDKVWYRAKITGMMASGQFEVMFVDYGNTDVVGLQQMRAIPPDFLKLPQQCFRCGLNGILPGDDGTWTNDEIDTFYNMTAERPQKVYIYAYYDPEEQYLIEVFDGQTNVNKSLGQLLGKLSSSKRDIGSPQPPTHPCPGSLRNTRDAGNPGDNTWASWQGSQSQQPVKITDIPRIQLQEDDYVDVYIAFSENPSRFWCHLVKGSTDLDSLMDRLNVQYSALGPGEQQLSHAMPGQMCCAKYSEDNHWYRALILEVSGPKLKMQFVDYGNQEYSNLDEVKALSREFTSLPIQAFECSLTGLQPSQGNWSPEACEKFEEITAEKKLVGAIVGKVGSDCYLIELVDGNKQVHDGLIRAGFGISTSSPPRPAPPVSGHIRHSSGSSSSSRASNRSSRGVTPNRSVGEFKTACTMEFKNEYPKVNSFLDVNVVHVLNPEHFYCQLTAQSADLDSLMRCLGDEYGKLGSGDLEIPRPKPGIVCCAKFSEDNSWYRAEVTDYDGYSKVHVRFVDYGNDEWMGIDRIKLLRPTYLDLPIQAIRCSLEGLNVRSWTEEANAKFEDLTIDKNLVAKIMQRDASNFHILRLMDSSSGTNVDIGEELISSGLVPGLDPSVNVSPHEIIEGKSYRVTLPWITHPKEFWCQPTRSVKDLGALTDKMNKYYSNLAAGTDKISNPGKGQVCAVCFAADGSWYRAVITAISPDKVKAKVRFLDYGNTEKCQVSALKKLKENFSTMPAQAFLCALQGVEMKNGQWGESIVAEFQQLAQQTVTCRILRRASELAYVSIQDEGGQDVLQKVSSGSNMRTKNRPDTTSRQQREGSAGLNKRESPPAGWGAAGDAAGDAGGWAAGGGASGSWDAGPSVPPQADAAAAASSERPTVSKATTSISLTSVLDDLKADQKVPVVIAHIDSANQFWCQLVQSTTDLDSMMEQLEAHYNQSTDTLPSLRPANLGSLCAAKYSEDGLWYRASVCKIHSLTEVDIHFVDYGNLETTQASSLKELNAEFGKLPKQAFMCKLAGIVSTLPAEATDKLHELTDEKELQMTVKTAKTACLEVNLETDGNVDINHFMKETFEQTPHAPIQDSTPLSFSTPIIPDGRVASYVTSVDSPSSFYVQLASHETEIANMADQLTATYNALGPDESKVKNTELGASCVAKFSEDESWYRAVITKKEGDQATVRFVDYGNSDNVAVSELKAVTPDLLSVPSYAVQCSLLNASLPPGGWTEDHKAQFEDLTLQEDKVTTVEFFSKSQPANVKFFVDDEDIGPNFSQLDESKTDEKRLPTQAKPMPTIAVPAQYYTSANIPEGCVNVYVTVVNSPGSFYVQLVSKETEVADLADQLTVEYESLGPEEKSIAQVVCGTSCVARFSEDGAWYRAMVTKMDGSNATVKFIDYGNTDEVLISELKEPSSDLLSIPAYAFHCALSGVSSPEGGWTEGHKTQFEKLTLEEDKTAEAEFLGREEPIKTRFHVDGNDIALHFSDGAREASSKEESADIEVMYERQDPNDQDREIMQPALEDDIPQPAAFVEVRAKSVSEDTSVSVEPASYPALEIPEGRVAVCVTAITSPCNFYVQLVSQEANVTEVTDKLAAGYDSLKPDEMVIEEVTLESACVAKFSEDGAWYRAIITGVEDDKADVMFVDYGNSDKVSVSDLKQISQDLLQVVPYAINCCLSEASAPPGGWVEEHRVQFEELTLQENVVTEAEFLYSAVPVPVKFYVDGEDIGPQYGIESDAKSDTSDLLVPPSTEATEEPAPIDMIDVAISYPAVTVPAGQVKAYVSHVENPGELYLHLQNEEDALNQLMENVDSVYSSLSQDDMKLKATEVGQVCCAQFSEDNAWYRAEITASRGEEVTVLFVDYGNSEITTDFSRLRLLKKQFAEAASFGIKVSLNDVEMPPNGWPENASNQLEELVLEKLLTVNFLTENSVSLLDEDLNINQKLKAKIHHPDLENRTEALEQSSTLNDVETPESKADLDTSRSPLASLKGKEMQVFMSAVETPAQFYLHLCDQESELNALMARLSEVYNDSGTPLESCAVGDLCCAKYAGDDLWYRALVKEVDGDDITVLFTDYGNVETVPVSEILCLNDEFKSAPAFGLEAFQSGADLKCEWSDDDINRFIDLTNEKALTVTFLNGQPPYEVLLKDNDMDIGTELGLVSRSLAQAVVEEVMQSVIEDGSDAGEDEEPDVCRSLKEVALSQEASSTLLDAGKKAEVYVSHVASPSHFCVQLAQLEEQLQTLMTKLAEAVIEMTQDSPVDLEPGSLCAAKYSDGEWYRSRVLNKEELELVVLFVDYGNQDKVSLTDVREIPSSCVTLEPQAVSCCLAGVKEPDEGWTEEGLGKFEELTLGKKLLAEVTQVSCLTGQNNICCVELRDMGISIGEELVKCGYAVKDKTSAPVSKLLDVTLDQTLNETCDKIGTTSLIQPIDLTVPCRLEGYVSHCDSPGHFWVQLKSNERTIEVLVDEMQEVCNQTAAPEDFTVCIGDYCAAQSAEDKTWYRACVSAVAEDQVSVLYVDYGNSEELPIAQLIPFPSQFTTTPVQALECCLAEIQPADTEWTDDAITEFTQLTLEKSLLIEFTAKDEDIYKVRVLDMGLSLGKKLVDAGLALLAEPDRSKLLDTTLQSLKFEEPALSEGETVEVYVTAWKSPGQFFCQLAKSSTELPLLMDRIQDHYSSGTPKLGYPSPGTACIAQYSQDQNWYRAEVLSTHGEECEVCFVDYGNTEVVSSLGLCEISADLLELPLQVFSSTLASVSPLTDTWDEASCGRFEELIGGDNKALAAKIFKVCRMDSGRVGQVLVELYDGEQSVSQQLVEGGYARYMEFSTDNEDTIGAEENYEASLLEQSVKSTAAEIVAQVLARASSEIEAEFEKDESDDSLVGDMESTRVEEVLTQQSVIAPSTSFALDMDSVVPVTYIRGDSPDDFLVHRSGADKVVQDLTMQISQGLEKTVEPSDQMWSADQLAVGDFCLALYAMDSSWYRAKVTAIRGDKFEVEMIDVGLKKKVRHDEVKSLPQEFVQLPAQAVHCSLAGIETEEWSEEAKSYFHQLCYGNSLSVSVVDQKLDVCQVYLYDMGDRSGESINKILVAEGFAWLTPNTEIEDDLDNADEQEELENSFLEVTLHKSNSLGSLTDNSKEDSLAVGPSYTYQSLSIGNEVDMLMFSAVDPDNIILQPASSESPLLELMTRLADTFEESSPEGGFDVYLGQPVAARYSIDKAWYRAKVFAIGEELVDVYYVDFGNAEGVSRENLRTLPAELMELPVQAVLCSLSSVKPLGTTWDKGAGSYLEKKFCGETEEGTAVVTTVTITNVEEDNRILAALKTSCREDAREMLINEKLALDLDAPEEVEEVDEELSDEEFEQPPEHLPDTQEEEVSATVCETYPDLPPLSHGDSMDILLSHTISPGQFWCQRNSDEVSDLMDQLQEYYISTSLESLKEGKENIACCAQYSEDDFWYRSKIESSCGDVLTVQFVDYGNSETTTLDKVKPLVQQFASIPPYAMQCTLAGVQPKNGIEWSDGAQNAFSDLSDQGMLMEVVSPPLSNLALVVSLSQRTSGGTVADMLINNGHARPTDGDSVQELGAGEPRHIDLNSHPQEQNLTSKPSPDEGFVSPSNETTTS